MHPETALGRRFRDALGLVNQRGGARPGEVVLMVAGCPVAEAAVGAGGGAVSRPSTARRAIACPTAVSARRAQRLDSLTKPRGSLGRLEELAVRVVAITGEPAPRVEAP